MAVGSQCMALQASIGRGLGCAPQCEGQQCTGWSPSHGSVRALCPVLHRSPVSSAWSWERGTCFLSSHSLLFSSVTLFQPPCQLSKRVQLIIRCLWIFHIPFKNVTTGVKCGLECWMPVPAAKLVTCCWLSAGPVLLCSAPYPFVFWFYVVHMFVSSHWLSSLRALIIYFSTLSFKPSTMPDIKSQ